MLGADPHRRAIDPLAVKDRDRDGIFAARSDARGIQRQHDFVVTILQTTEIDWDHGFRPGADVRCHRAFGDRAQPLRIEAAVQTSDQRRGDRRIQRVAYPVFDLYRLRGIVGHALPTWGDGDALIAADRAHHGDIVEQHVAGSATLTGQEKMLDA